jgi:ABC-type transport system involved in multi-copper enzyme maturation permease subunit
LERAREIGVIWSADLQRTVKSARVVVLLVLYGLFTGMALLVTQGIASKITEQAEAQLTNSGTAPEAMVEAKAQAHREFVKAFFSDDESMVDALLVIPLILLVVFKTTLRFIPLFCGVMGFDQISGEVGPKSIRYLTVRSRRSSVMLGKFLSQATVLAGLMLLIDVALCVHARVTSDAFTTGQMFSTLARFWLSSIVFSVAYLALTTLCSTLFRSPAVSLVFNVIVLFVIWLVAFIGEIFQLPGTELPEGALPKMTSVAGYLRYASVWHYGSDLLHPSASRFAIAALAHLGFGLLFLGLAYRVLRRRDL